VSWLACCVAIIVWDDNTWNVLSAKFVDEGHRTGALVHLLAAVQMRAIERVLAGDFAEAAALVEEKNLLTTVIGPTHGGESAAIFLAAWQGHELKNVADAFPSPSKTWGFEADVSCYATAVLCNALGQYKPALEAARTFLEDANGRWAPALPELVEAAMRCGQPELARLAVDRLATTTAASGTHWAAGLEALCRALTTDDDDTERLFLESIDHLKQTRVVTSLARVKLLYGEWLRRQGRRLDARRQLRAASDMFVSMGAEAFAARAGRELSATGERLPKRSVSPAVRLTSQETQIVRLAMDGQANAEIAAQMFISPRTVEYHLHKIFTKLGITSRNQLGRALRQPPVTPLLVGNPAATLPVTGRSKAPTPSGPPAAEPPGAEPGQGDGEGQEDPGLDPLQGPVAVGGLVGDGLPEAMAFHALRRGGGLEAVDRRLAGDGEIADGLARRVDGSAGDKPGAGPAGDDGGG